MKRTAGPATREAGLASQSTANERKREPMSGLRAVVVDPETFGSPGACRRRKVRLQTALVEVGGEGPIAVLLEETRYLGPGNARDRELGDLVLAEEARSVGVHVG